MDLCQVALGMGADFSADSDGIGGGVDSLIALILIARKSSV